MRIDYVVYGSPNCGWCDKAKELLSSQGYSYNYIDIVGTPEARDLLKAEGLTTVPQIWRNGKEYRHIGGYQELLKELSE